MGRIEDFYTSQDIDSKKAASSSSCSEAKLLHKEYACFSSRASFR